jgi:hypothetical protein
MPEGRRRRTIPVVVVSTSAVPTHRARHARPSWGRVRVLWIGSEEVRQHVRRRHGRRRLPDSQGGERRPRSYPAARGNRGPQALALEARRRTFRSSRIPAATSGWSGCRADAHDREAPSRRAQRWACHLGCFDFRLRRGEIGRVALGSRPAHASIGGPSPRSPYRSPISRILSGSGGVVSPAK